MAYLTKGCGLMLLITNLILNTLKVTPLKASHECERNANFLTTFQPNIERTEKGNVN